MDLSNCPRERLERELLGEADVHALAMRCGEVAAGVRPERDGRLARRLAAARELLLRETHHELAGRCVFDAPSKVREYLRLHLAALEREVFVVLMLDAQHRLLGIEELFRGTLTQTSVYPREVVRAALRCNAAALLFAHNHPSGSAEPSRADEQLTQTLKAALALVDVRVLDHFVVASGSTVSMAERGLL